MLPVPKVPKTVYLPITILSRVDGARGKHTPLPSFSQMIGHLVEVGLQVEEKVGAVEAHANQRNHD